MKILNQIAALCKTYFFPYCRLFPLLCKSSSCAS